MTDESQHVNSATIVGLGLLLMPMLTMWHEVAGHAATCAVQGGHVTTLGAFYVNCEGWSGMPRLLVSVAGVMVDSVLAVVVFGLWRRARGDMARLTLWLVWVTEAFVAAGYFCFSGVTGVGDLGPGVGGGIGLLPLPYLWRAVELAAGIAAYLLLVRAAIRALTAMLGDAAATGPARRVIAHGYYATIGVAAVLVGLLNPIGILITIMSAAASSFGGNAGMISIGFAVPRGSATKPFVIGRSWAIIAVGVVVFVGFAFALGPSRQFAK